jgi:uncharacterized membrane protein YbhN (UPF0104 family)
LALSSIFRRHETVIRLGGVAGLALVVIWSVDFGDAMASLLAADAVLVGCGLALVQAQIVLSAVRWRFTARRLGVSIPFGIAVAEYYLASLLNMVLPGGVGGDAVRALRSRSALAGTSEDQSGPAVRSVILERLAGQAAFFCIAVCGLAAWPLLQAAALPEGTGMVVLLPLLMAAAAIILAVGMARHGPATVRAWLRELGPDMRKAWLQNGSWMIQGALSTTIALLYIAVFALSTAAVGAPMAPGGWFTVIPLVLLTMLVPISVGGFGLREGAAAFLWPIVGLSSAAGLAAALLYGLISLAGALPGLLVLLKRSQPRSSRA